MKEKERKEWDRPRPESGKKGREPRPGEERVADGPGGERKRRKGWKKEKIKGDFHCPENEIKS